MPNTTYESALENIAATLDSMHTERLADMARLTSTLERIDAHLARQDARLAALSERLSAPTVRDRFARRLTLARAL